MDVSIIIVNWNVKDLLRQCLASVYAQTKGVSFEVLVVDNASDDGSVAMVMEEFPEVTLIPNKSNVGFAAGNNVAIDQAEGDFVFLLNPDAELKSDALSIMVRYMKEHPYVGILGPRLVYPDGSHQDSVRHFPTLLSQVLIMLKLHRVFPKLPVLKKYFATDFDYESSQTVDQIMGAAFMIRGSVIESLGKMDEGFFIWFEEVDYCKRAAKAGIQTWYTSTVEIVHHCSKSFAQQMAPTKQRHFDRSMRYYMQKHHGVLPALLILALHPIAMALSWLSTLTKRKTAV